MFFPMEVGSMSIWATVASGRELLDDGGAPFREAGAEGEDEIGIVDDPVGQLVAVRADEAEVEAVRRRRPSRSPSSS